MSERLKAEHALITGAGGGIGLAVTKAYLDEGASCTAVDLGASPPAGLAALIASHPALGVRVLCRQQTRAVSAQTKVASTYTPNHTPNPTPHPSPR